MTTWLFHSVFGWCTSTTTSFMSAFDDSLAEVWEPFLVDDDDDPGTAPRD